MRQHPRKSLVRDFRAAALAHHPQAAWAPATQATVALLEAGSRPWTGAAEDQALVDLGRAEQAAIDPSAVATRYARNPLEHVRRIVFEYTTACGQGCLHCRCARLPPVTERRPEALVQVVDTAVDMGIRRFDFIGGAPTKSADSPVGPMGCQVSGIRYQQADFSWMPREHPPRGSSRAARWMESREKVCPDTCLADT